MQSSDLPVIYFGHLSGQFDTLDCRSARTVTPPHKRKEGTADRTRSARAGPVMGHPPIASDAKPAGQ